MHNSQSMPSRIENRPFQKPEIVLIPDLRLILKINVERSSGCDFLPGTMSDTRGMDAFASTPFSSSATFSFIQIQFHLFHGLEIKLS